MFYDDWIIDLLFLQVLVIHASIDYIIQYSFTSIYNLPDTVILGGRRGSLPSSNGINKAQLSFILIIGGETYDNQGITEQSSENVLLHELSLYVIYSYWIYLTTLKIKGKNHIKINSCDLTNNQVGLRIHNLLYEITYSPYRTQFT